MANEINSPNMNLPIPVVGNDPSPDWGFDLNNSLTIIDGHNHESGSGVPITPGGLNINSALPFNDNPLINAQSLGFFTQLSDPNGLGLLYYKGVDLYFNDGSSNHIRITQSGSVTGASGTITGLPSGTASASYNAGTFVFQSATNTAANIDGGSFILRNSTASSHGLTLSPPNAMASDYSLTLPNTPTQTNVMTLTSGGAMGSITYDAVGQGMTSIGADAIGISMDATGANAVAASRTRASGTATVGIGGIALSASSSLFSTTSNGHTNVPGLSVTISTSGRSVQLMLVCDFAAGGTNTGIVGINAALSGTYRSIGVIEFTLGGSQLAQCPIVGTVIGPQTEALAIPCSACAYVDDSVAGTPGTYVYGVSLSAQGFTGDSVFVGFVRLKAWEL